MLDDTPNARQTIAHAGCEPEKTTLYWSTYFIVYPLPMSAQPGFALLSWLGTFSYVKPHSAIHTSNTPM